MLEEGGLGMGDEGVGRRGSWAGRIRAVMGLEGGGPGLEGLGL